MSSQAYDLAVVGGGVIGLAHAYWAAKAGKRVAVIERDPRANGASIRNFGFITVTGQERGNSWRLARRTRDVWAVVAPQAGIPIEQHGLYLTARSHEAVAVIEAFLATEMGEGCRLLPPEEFRRQAGGLGGSDLMGALYSPHDLRVESRHAIPRLTAWLKQVHGVTFFNETVVFRAAPPQLATSRGVIEAGAKRWMLDYDPLTQESSHFRNLLGDPQYQLLHGAPALIVIAAPQHARWAREGCSLAAENIMLAATALGLGTCWIGLAEGWLNGPEGRTALGLPADSYVVGAIAVGYPAAVPPPASRRQPSVTWIGPEEGKIVEDGEPAEFPSVPGLYGALIHP